MRTSRLIPKVRDAPQFPGDQRNRLVQTDAPLCAFGDAQAAASYFERAVRRDLAAGPDALARLPRECNQLAAIYVNLGRLSDAVRVLHLALPRPPQDGIFTDLDVATSYHLLGDVLQIQGRFSDAEAAYKTALNRVRQPGREPDFLVASLENSVGWMYDIMGRQSDAESTLDCAWKTAKSSLPADSPELLTFLDTKASVLCQRSRYAEAEKLWFRAWDIGKKTSPTDPNRYSAILAHLGEMCSALGEYKSAENVLLQVVKVRPGVTLSLSHAVLLSELSGVYLKLQDYSKAQPLIADQPVVAANLSSLSQALEKLDRNKEAKRYQERAKRILALCNDRYYSDDTVDVRAFRGK